MLPRVVVSYLTADFPWAEELMAFWISFQGAKEVCCIPVVHDIDTATTTSATMEEQHTTNHHGGSSSSSSSKSKKKKMHWCHALLLTLVTGQGGVTFAPLWMGKSISMLQHDFHVACCIFCFVLFTYILPPPPPPANHNEKDNASMSASSSTRRWLCQSIWVTSVTVAFSQLFRAMAICQYTSQANQGTFLHHATSSNKFYPIPIFAPIAHGALLGNLGGFFSKSFHNHMDQQGKVPWSFQNAITCSAFYHFLVHDQTGSIGRCLRHCIYHYLVPSWPQGNDEQFAMIAISLFMQIVGFLQMPHLLGANFNPFLLRLSTRRIRATLVVQVDDDRTERSSYCTSPIPPCQSQEQDIIMSMDHSNVMIGPDSHIQVSDTFISHDDSLDRVTTRRSMKWKHPRWKMRKRKAA